MTVLCAGLLSCSGSTDSTVESFFHEIDGGDVPAALARFSPRVREKLTDGQLAQAVTHWSQDFKAHGGIKHMSLSGAVVTMNQLSLYDVTLTFGDGTQRSLQTSVIRVGGAWYINSAL